MAVHRINAEVAAPLHMQLGEGPLWDDSTQTLLFVDIDGKRVHRFDPGTASVSTFSTPGPVGCLALCSDGGLLLATGRSLVRCKGGGDDQAPLDGPVLDERVRFNDGAVDPWGGFVVGTMDLHVSQPIGALYRVCGDGQVTTLLDNVTISNGLGWTLDSRSMFYTDSATGAIDRFDVNPDGVLGSRHRFASFAHLRPGGPDGLAVDAEGGVWVALWGASCVQRLDAAGAVDRIVDLPTTNVTSVAFGGARLDQLYITTARSHLTPEQQGTQPHAGDLFVALPGVAGMPTNRFPVE
jgi:sugar lactone lactonase YvrE